MSHPVHLTLALALAALAICGAKGVEHGTGSLNSQLSYTHAKNNLAHLRVLPLAPRGAPEHGGAASMNSNNDSTRIHYTHNISRTDGSHDVVHYNVSHVVGVISLDFIPEVRSAECNETHVTVSLTDMSIATDWRAGIPFVGGHEWGCIGEPLKPVHGTADPRALPFYRRIEGVSRDEARHIVTVSTKTITIFEIFHGTVHVKHVPPAKPAKKSAPLAQPAKKSAQPVPTHHAPEPTAEHRKLQSSSSCSAHNGNCGSCLRSTEPGSFYGTYDCSYCTGDETCVSANPSNSAVTCPTGEQWLGTCTRCAANTCNAPPAPVPCATHSGDCSTCLASFEAGNLYGVYSCAYCTGDATCVSNNPTHAGNICTGKWLGGKGDNVCTRCEAESCAENSRCRKTNDNHCDEGGGGCPDWTDENDCSGSSFNTFNGGCEFFEQASCSRCLEAPAVGGGYCGWNPEGRRCMTSRLYYADDYGRCDPCPDHYLHNGVCDGPPGWVQPGTGICAIGLDTDVINGQSCNGDINDGGDSGEGFFEGHESLFRFGQEGYHDCPNFSGGTCQIEAYVSLSTSYHLAIDFDYDDFYGVPVRLQSMTATVGGEFDAEAGFEINAGEITIDIGPKQIFAGNLARITIYIGPIPLTLNFEGELSYGAHVNVQGPAVVHASGELTYTKSVQEGVMYDGEMHRISDTHPAQQTYEPLTITGGTANTGAAVTVALIPRVTMTVEHILPFFVELIPWIKAEVADSSGGESTGVSVGMDASFGLDELNFGSLIEYCADQEDCVNGLHYMATLGGILPYQHDFTIFDADCIEGSCGHGPSGGGASLLPVLRQRPTIINNSPPPPSPSTSTPMPSTPTPMPTGGSSAPLKCTSVEGRCTSDTCSCISPLVKTQHTVGSDNHACYACSSASDSGSNEGSTATAGGTHLQEGRAERANTAIYPENVRNVSRDGSGGEGGGLLDVLFLLVLLIGGCVGCCCCIKRAVGGPSKVGEIEPTATGATTSATNPLSQVQPSSDGIYAEPTKL